MDSERHEFKTLYGTRSSNSCAYCWKHYRAMTPRQVAKKECLKKQCAALEKHDHPYWEQRAKAKEKRVARRERLEKLYEEVTDNGVRP